MVMVILGRCCGWWLDVAERKEKNESDVTSPSADGFSTSTTPTPSPESRKAFIGSFVVADETMIGCDGHLSTPLTSLV